MVNNWPLLAILTCKDKITFRASRNISFLFWTHLMTLWDLQAAVFCPRLMLRWKCLQGQHIPASLKKWGEKKCWIKALKTKVKSQNIARSSKRISEAVQHRMLSFNHPKVSQKDILWFTTKSMLENKSPAVWLISGISCQVWKHWQDSCFCLFSRHSFSITDQKTHIIQNERAPSSLFP